MKVDHMKRSEKGSLALLLEDLLISELCPLEENASHHKTSFQEVDFLKISKILTKSWRMATISARIQNLGWTQLESTLKIMRVAVENSSFGYNLTFEIWISEVLAYLREDASISETCPLEESASHHIG